MKNTINLAHAIRNGVVTGIKRRDAGIAEQLIINLETEAFTDAFDELLYDSVLPVTRGQNLAIAGFSHSAYDIQGKAKIIGGYSDDLPSATFTESAKQSKVKMLGISYHYNIMEIAQAAAVGAPLQENRATAARFGMENALNDIAFNGEEASGLYGLFNHPSVTISTVAPNAAATSTMWADKTADEILADIHHVVALMVEQSNNKMHPTDIYLPLQQFNHISVQRIANTETTVLKWLLDNSPYITQGMIQPLTECKDASLTGLDVMTVMNKNKRYFSMEIPYSPQFLEANVKALYYKRPMVGTTGGLVVRDARAIIIAEGI